MAPKLRTHGVTTIAVFAAVVLASMPVESYADDHDSWGLAETFRGHADDLQQDRQDRHDLQDRHVQQDGRNRKGRQDREDAKEPQGLLERRSARAAAVPPPVRPGGPGRQLYGGAPKAPGAQEPGVSARPGKGGVAHKGHGPGPDASSGTSTGTTTGAGRGADTGTDAGADTGVKEDARPGQGAGRGPKTSADARPKSSPKTSPSASPSPSLAGRPAGEGRERPGRTAAPPVSTATTPEAGHDSGRQRELTPRRAREREREQARERERERMKAELRKEAEMRKRLLREQREREARDAHTSAPAAPVPPPTATPSPTAPARVGKAAPPSSTRPLERQIPVMTLGAGCALMGLGLGYMGLRLRRY
ncbi:hypothetical protein [Streptomyces sp. NPDC002133]|uniref:hypothetical protein n=1 Tax=Streptomyces sp. NPDC002133 TaxID=3154409 RepID=UPI003322DC74